MRLIKTTALILSLFFLNSCAELTQIAQSVASQNLPLTNTEIVAGLKEALLVGTDSSVNHLSAVDGYLKDQAVKILLPSEAKNITDNLSKLPGGQKLVEDVIVRINRAAEDAAKGAKPIFVNSVKEMTFADALQILKGPDNAATQYFKSKTAAQLGELYRPKIRESLNKNLVAGISTQQSWNELTNQWNKIAGSSIGKIAGMKPVDVKLEDYLLQQALNGLFLKIEEREKDIRTNANARVTALLKRVFGSPDVAK
ncbi:MAG: DUF4197 domain-containing protein [Prolixibacteraceae bacterium]|nr:DUF4197 domain-containing protein [Prolixibacteraceae bacterium]